MLLREILPVQLCFHVPWVSGLLRILIIIKDETPIKPARSFSSCSLLLLRSMIFNSWEATLHYLIAEIALAWQCSSLSLLHLLNIKVTSVNMFWLMFRNSRVFWGGKSLRKSSCVRLFAVIFKIRMVGCRRELTLLRKGAEWWILIPYKALKYSLR